MRVMEKYYRLLFLTTMCMSVLDEYGGECWREFKSVGGTVVHFNNLDSIALTL